MTDQSTVSIARCPEYGVQAVENALRRALDPLGGMAAYVQPGQRVALKPNLLRPTSPDRVATTHPAVVAAVARLVRDAGGEPFIIDSPGGPSNASYVRRVYRATEMTRAAQDGGAELVADLEAVAVPWPQGLLLKRVDLLKAAVEADVLINIPKLKTHGLTGLTVAVKNLFGLVPGIVKVAYHSRMQNARDFSRGLLDIADASGATLHIVDAVVGMEGNGPSAGTPREVGAILAGRDALAVDVTAAALVGLDPRLVRTTDVAVEHGRSTGRLEDVCLLGEPLENLRVASFRLSDTFSRRMRESEAGAAVEAHGHPSLRGWWKQWSTRQILLTPHAGSDCTGCGLCARHCPVEAIAMDDGHAEIDAARCIRCYCCHELCPALAIELKRPLLGRVLARL